MVCRKIAEIVETQRYCRQGSVLRRCIQEQIQHLPFRSERIPAGLLLDESLHEKRTVEWIGFQEKLFPTLIKELGLIKYAKR